jgi:hypothetical protein
VRKLLKRRSGPAPKADATLDELMRDARDHWEKVCHPTGTIRQYRSDWNTHIPAKIGAVPCREVDISHYTAIFNKLNEERASEQVIDAVARTLGAVTVKFGVLNGYFPDGQPFGGPDLRRAAVAGARATAARQNRARKVKQIHLDECPTPADVDKYAAAFEEEYPGYGARLVWLAFGTGLRIDEALALRWDSINLDTLDVAVDWQLDRYGTWPALALPKGNKPRVTRGCGPATPRSRPASSRTPSTVSGPTTGGCSHAIAPRRSGRTRPASSPARPVSGAGGSGGASTGCATGGRPGRSRRSRTAATRSTPPGSRSGSATRS